MNFSSGVQGLDEEDKPSSSSDKNTPSNVQAAASKSRPKTGDKRDVVKRLESGGRILSLIKKAETKKVAKRKIITFLKKKGVSETKIIEAYADYYKEEGLYEITFSARPLGFSVIMDTRGKNAIVSSIQDENNQKLGMKVASRIYEIHGKRVDDMKHKEILRTMSQQNTPFYVVFKESRKKSSKLNKINKKIEQGLQFKTEEEMNQSASDDSDSDTISSYDSDDDEAHVYHHYSRKSQMQGKNGNKKRKKRGGNETKNGTLFKPHELDQWDESRLADEQAAMLKQLSQLMMGAVSAVDHAKNAPNGAPAAGGAGGASQAVPTADVVSLTAAPAGVDGMSHKRQKTLKTLLDVAASPDNQQAKHEIKKSISSRKFSVTDLEVGDSINEECDPEILKYLQELVGGPSQHAPLTPSTSRLMKDLFADTEDELSLNMPEYGQKSYSGDQQHFAQYSMSSGGYPSTYSPNGTHASQSSADMKSEDDDKDEDVIESLENGATMLKYGKYGKPKYKEFTLTQDHKYLVWFSPKKSKEETRIKIKEIRKIAIGSESKVVERTKQTDLLETSFTIYYGKSNNDKMWKSLTVTAKNEKEAFVWAQGLKILSDSAKQGRHIRSLSTAQIHAQQNDEELSKASNSELDPDDVTGRHDRAESVIISIDKMQRQSTVFNIFNKSSAATASSLLKQHAKHKQQLQKCVDFVMTKANYRAIANAGQFDKVKMKLEDLDNRLRKVKSSLNATDDISQSDLSSVKADLFSCAADLDALKQKLTAIVRRPQKL